MDRATILLVDDDATCRHLGQAVLERAGHRVVTAPDGTSALARMRNDRRLSHEIELVVLDYVMPGLDGFQTFDAMREARADLAGLLVTGLSNLQVAVDALNRGFSQVVLKPLDATALLDAVGLALRERRARLENQRLRALTRLYDSLDQLAAVGEADELYDCIVRLAVAQTSADTASLMLLDAAQSVLRMTAAVGLDERVIGTATQPVGEPIAGWVAKNGVTLELTPGRRLPQSIVAAMRRPEVGAAVCLPLLVSGRSVGVLNLSRLGDVHGFAPGDVEVATVLASDAALTIERLALLQERARGERVATVGRLASSIIHDLRGPITVIRGAAELIEELDPDARETARRIDRQVDSLDQMCSQLLSFARESAASAATPERVPLAGLLQAVEEAVRPLFDERGIRLQLEGDLEAELEVYRSELHRALVHVLETACQAAAPASTVVLAARLLPDAARLIIAGRAPERVDWGSAEVGGVLVPEGTASLSVAMLQHVVARHRGRTEWLTHDDGYDLRVELPRRAA